MAETGAGNTKLQRWMDLLSALLARAFPVSFEELAKAVPDYQSQLSTIEGERDEGRRKRLQDALKRTFERDKDELRSFGIPLESLPDEDGNEGGAYLLRRKNFYLPYLCLVMPGGGTTKPRIIDRYGYRALASLSFEPEELQAVVDAATFVRSLGDPLLATEVASALRKLAVDLPVDAVAVSRDAPSVLLSRAQPMASLFESLADALARRKRVQLEYFSMTSGQREDRSVEPYGLFFLNGHWYLAARDDSRAALRNLRLDRIAAIRVDAKRPGSPDFEIPAEFQLKDHARSRQAWELGDGAPRQVTVAFPGKSGPATAAAKLGEPVPGRPALRAFEVRRPEVFVRWLLSFAGEAEPVEPASIVEAYRAEARRTMELYGKPPAEAQLPVKPRDRSPATQWEPKTAASQLRRILQLVPRLADGEAHSLNEVAKQLGTRVETLRKDLYSLVTRFDAPGGFVEGVQLYLESDRVSAEAGDHFLRPMRLTAPELCALELGLAVLRQQRPPGEHAVLESALSRLRAIITQLPQDRPFQSIASPGEAFEQLAPIRLALREQRKLRLVYRKSGSSSAAERVVHPRALVAETAMLYLIAEAGSGEGIRVFRLDRIESAQALDERFTEMSDLSLERMMTEGKAFMPPVDLEGGGMVVRYSPRIARWIAEREGVELEAAGGLLLERVLADPEWGLRHVLQYGAEAEVIEPAGLRARLRERLARMASGES
jgi:predicted DNA-binding transcriptional regulator YafY